MTSAKTLALVLQSLAPVFFIVGALHLVLGVRADVLLGASVSDSVLRDAVIDSQNRFYGISFTIYGVLLLLCASDLDKYRTVLRCLLWVFFAAGLARVVSISTHGIPSSLVMVLLTIELVLPPVLLRWLSVVERDGWQSIDRAARIDGSSNR